MAAKQGSRTPGKGSGSLVDGLAKTVISKVSAAPLQRSHRRVEIGAKILYAAVLDRNGFDMEQVRADLSALRIPLTDIVDLCIPQVANELGVDWVEDRLSFAQVSTGSARLFGLCKAIGQEWDNIRPRLNARTLLLVTVEREDHILGPAVLADQLRRRGHSVFLHSNATAASICLKLKADRYDGLLISVSTTEALETAAKAIKEIRSEGASVLIVLGGTALTEAGIDPRSAGADLTTNNIDTALDAMTGDDIDLRVAE